MTDGLEQRLMTVNYPNHQTLLVHTIAITFNITIFITITVTLLIVLASAYFAQNLANSSWSMEHRQGRWRTALMVLKKARFFSPYDHRYILPCWLCEFHTLAMFCLFVCGPVSNLRNTSLIWLRLCCIFMKFQFKNLETNWNLIRSLSFSHIIKTSFGKDGSRAWLWFYTLMVRGVKSLMIA